jgi:hypothetical protein
MRVLRRIAPVVAPFVVLFVLWVPSAGAWTWPVGGTVLQGFTFDHAHPYAAGQHRGIDVGAAPGEPVRAPTAGVVGFAGTVPASGKSVTIETPDGLSVTLTHLGSIAVARDAAVSEGAVIGTVGPSGTPEVEGPYVHLGVRTTSDDQGYLDPLGFLPVLAPPAPAAPSVVPPAPAAAPVTAPAPAASPAPSAAPAPPVVDVPQAVTSGVAAGPPVVSPSPSVAVPPAVSEPVAAAPPTGTQAVHDALPTAADPPQSAARVPAPSPEPVPARSGVPAPPAVAPPAAAETAPAAIAPAGESTPVAKHGPARRSFEPLSFPAGALPHPASSALPTAAFGSRAAPARTAAAPFSRAVGASLDGAAKLMPVGRLEAGARGTVDEPVALPAVLRPPRSLATLVLALLGLVGFGAGGFAAARIIRSPVIRTTISEGVRPVAPIAEDPRGARVAVREWAAPYRPRGRIRRAGGRVRALSPAEGQRRADGQRDGRARHAGDGVRRPGRRIAA